MLTFEQLRAANVARCARWHPGGIDDWSLTDWAIATAGELGEALNLVKKLNRERDGITGNDATFNELILQLADELADTLIYADLLAARAGVSPMAVTGRNLALADLRGLADKVGSRGSFEDFEIERPDDFAHDRSNSERARSMLVHFGGVFAAVDELEDLNDPDPRAGPILVMAVADRTFEAILRLGFLAEGAGIDIELATRRKFNRTSEKNGFPDRI